jgi:hypothetical protein
LPGIEAVRGDRPTPAAQIVRAIAEFMDRSGVVWKVMEVDAASVPAARGEACLLFVAPHAIRRVWTYPRDWQRLPAAGLEELSWAW